MALLYYISFERIISYADAKPTLWLTKNQKIFFSVLPMLQNEFQISFLVFSPQNFRNYKIFLSWNNLVHVSQPESLKGPSRLEYKPPWKLISNPFVTNDFNPSIWKKPFLLLFWNPIFHVPSSNPQDNFQLDSREQNEKKMLSHANTIWPSEFS